MLELCYRLSESNGIALGVIGIILGTVALYNLSGKSFGQHRRENLLYNILKR